MAAFDSNADGFGDQDPSKKTAAAYPPSTVATATPATGAQATAPYTADSTPSTPAASGFGDSQPAATAAPAAAAAPQTTWGDGQGGQYSWNAGDYGAEGAWTNGYNPHWDYASAPQSAPSASGASTPQASASAAYGPGQELPYAGANPRGGNGFGDARDNPNNTMSEYEDPVTHRHYNDFDNPALQVSPGGTLVGKTATSTWDPTAIYTDPTSPFYGRG